MPICLGVMAIFFSSSPPEKAEEQESEWESSASILCRTSDSPSKQQARIITIILTPVSCFSAFSDGLLDRFETVQKFLTDLIVQLCFHELVAAQIRHVEYVGHLGARCGDLGQLD